MGLEEKSKQGEEVFEAELRREFVDRRAGILIVERHTLRSEFLRESLQYGIDKGWLQRGEDKDDVLGSGMGQCLSYGLTGEGKKHFGIKDDY